MSKERRLARIFAKEDVYKRQGLPQDAGDQDL